jgi:hypothetical protein
MRAVNSGVVQYLRSEKPDSLRFWTFENSSPMHLLKIAHSFMGGNGRTQPTRVPKGRKKLLDFVNPSAQSLTKVSYLHPCLLFLRCLQPQR